MIEKSEERVVLVTDSAARQGFVTRQLVEWGLSAIFAASEVEALEILKGANGPILVLVDWDTPGLDGSELCRKLRDRSSTEAYAYTILLLTEKDCEHRLRLMSGGINDYLVKPFDERELRGCLLAGQRMLRLQGQMLAARQTMSSAIRAAGARLSNQQEITSFLPWVLDKISDSDRVEQSEEFRPTFRTHAHAFHYDNAV